MQNLEPRNTRGGAPTPALTPEEMVAAHQRIEVSQHPFFVELAKRPVDLGSVYLLMANLQVGISPHFVPWLARTIERVEDRRIGSLLAKQLNDELGRGDFAQIHTRLLDTFVAALAPWRPAGRDEALLACGAPARHRRLAAVPGGGSLRRGGRADRRRDTSPRRWTPAWRPRCAASTRSKARLSTGWICTRSSR